MNSDFDESYTSSIRDLRALTQWEGKLSLMSFNLGGVQDFVATARTTRDVWAGSYLISQLSVEAVRKVLVEIARGVSKPGALPEEMLHWVLAPKIETLTTDGFSNRVLLLIPTTAECAIPYFQAARRGVEDAWKLVVKECREKFSGEDRLTEDGYDTREWNRQTAVRRIFEVYTIAIGLPQSSAEFEPLRPRLALTATGYGALVESAWKVLNARKLLRDFAQSGEAGPRCSLCGARSALADYTNRPYKGFLPSRRESRNDILDFQWGTLDAYWQRVRLMPDLRFRVRDGERLCAVCVIRRLSAETARKVTDVDFPSTRRIVLAPAIRRLADKVEKDAEERERVEGFVRQIGKAERLTVAPSGQVALPYFRGFASRCIEQLAAVDELWLRPENHRIEALVDAFRCSDVKAAQAVEALGKAKFPELLLEHANHFAVIAADGDEMGNWMNGRNWPDGFDLAQQQRLSASLLTFAREVRRELEVSMPGRVVYAGGDDVLAFVPREYALRALCSIVDTFDQHVGGLAGEKRITISAACILARQNDPLQESLELAQHHLKESAKERYGRNSIAFYRTSRGGKATGIKVRVDSASMLNLLIRVHDHMAELASPDCTTGLSARLADALARNGDSLAFCHASPGGQAALASLIAYETARHYHPSGDNEEARAEATRTAQKDILRLFRGLRTWEADHVRESQSPGDPSFNAFEEFLGLLGTLRFLTRRDPWKTANI